MRQYTPVQSSLTCRFAYRNVLPGLPVPGTPAFSQLCKELKKFGFSGEKYILETPSGKLSEARINIPLLQDSLSLRLHYEWFEVVIPVLIEGAEKSAIDIANTALAALALLDDDARNGDLVVHSLAHLKLASEDPDSYLSEHLIGGSEFCQPDAFALTLNIGGDKAHRKGRVVIARSLGFAGALFVDYEGEYPGAEFRPALVEEVRSEYKWRLQDLGLEAAS
ncbi:MAG: hypothetical protein LAQ69_38355 [Acidobacteriia bacterium]|nr:hypothetical protein [Terriglobia bacterium]